ncbi:EAL and HDOD domain-containing protein [Litchfieldella rifensis]|uniref:EAL and HDOD domain-containing protein n=1 Tax=Litchfieldella rifensis TaxID=762643 RepID=A0ABV7LSC8_9GAMM
MITPQGPTAPYQQDAPSTDYCIALQPICDAEYRHVGDELLYRSHAGADSASISDPLVATARASSMAIYEIGLDRLVGDRLLFMNVSREWLERPELLPLPADKVVIEILESVEASEPIIAALRFIKSRGFRIALDDYVVNKGNAALLSLADIVKVDVVAGYEPHHLTLYRDHGCTLLAEKVENLEEFERTKAEGFSLFQGFFFAHPHNVASRRTQRRNNSSIQIKLIRELYRELVNLEHVADMIALDPHLYLTVIKRANSSYFGHSETTNLKRCLQLLGLNELRTLVATVMLSQNGPICRLTMQHALTRAFMCKHLAAPFRDIDAEDAFTTGLFSLMDAMLGVEMRDLLEEIPLDSGIARALLTGNGTLGAILTLARDYQQLEAEEAAQPSQELRGCYLRAVEETQAIMQAI